MSRGGDWDPGLYARFGEERTRPALDLALRARSLLGWRELAGASRAILDLGCGPGNSTAVLAAIFPGAALTGLDSSPAMIEAARESGLEAEWLVADAATWEAARSFDLIFSNAALQWIPDQAGLLARLWASLAPGGLLAVQVPGNGESGLHRALLATAAGPAWRSRFEAAGEAISYREPPFYYEALSPLGGRVELWETTYWHLLASQAAMIDWYSGTGMRPWLNSLRDEAERTAFKAEVLDAARPSYPPRADGSIFFPFRRIFFTAEKRGETT
jgi:trans-aconitate 2-methyltransferase